MKNKFFKFLALSLAATLLPGTTVCADDSSDYVHVDVFGSVYYGTLTTAKNGKSSVFTTVPGKWFSIYNNREMGYQYICIYSGLYNCLFRWFYSIHWIQQKRTDSGWYPNWFSRCSYQTFSAASGKPYKALRTFSSSDELTAIDWYYKCTLMSTWKSDADTVDYDTLMETPYEYIDLPFTVKGTCGGYLWRFQ